MHVDLLMAAAMATSVRSCHCQSYKIYFMTESQCTEKVCVSTNCFMKTLSRALKDSTKDSLSRDGLAVSAQEQETKSEAACAKRYLGVTNLA
jgi:hypothetical protein